MNDVKKRPFSHLGILDGVEEEQGIGRIQAPLLEHQHVMVPAVFVVDEADDVAARSRELVESNRAARCARLQNTVLVSI